jgi:S-(hydroxymethyl)glutathione dehydrogenase/alcohol dehydrogenase
MCVAGRPVLCDRLLKTTYRNRLPGGGTRLRARGQDVAHFNSTACFADYVVIAEEGAIPIPQDVPFAVLATIGCAVVTGVGAVNNAVRVEAGNSVVIIGAGGVGLNVAQGASLAKCNPIIAVDLRATALTLARDFGATHTVEAATQNVVEAVRELTKGRGADYVFDTVGLPATIAQAIECARKGGSIVLTGLSRTDTLASIPAFPFVMQEKRLIGSVYGSGQPVVDIPRLVELYRDGKLKLRELVTHSYRLDEVNDALSTLAGGTDARGIIEW